MADPGPEVERSFPNVSEPPLGGDPEQPSGFGEDCLSCPKELGGPPETRGINSDEPEPTEEPVLLDSNGVDRSKLITISKLGTQHDPDEWIPPGRVVQNDQDGFAGGWKWVAGVGHSQCVEVLAHISDRILSEAPQEPQPAAGEFDSGSSSGVCQ
jgi:hypothetical protein